MPKSLRRFVRKIRGNPRLKEVKIIVIGEAFSRTVVPKRCDAPHRCGGRG